MRKKALVFALIILTLLSLLIFAACNGQPTVQEVAVFKDEDAGLTFTLFKVNKKGEDSYNYVKVTEYFGRVESGTEVIKVTVPSKVTIEGTEYAVNTVGSLVFDHKKISEIELEEGISEVESFAFSYCEANIVTLPSTVKKIGPYAFVNCNYIKVLRIKAEEPPQLGDYAFKFYMEKKNVYEVNSTLRIYVPKSAVDFYKSEWAEYAEIIVR